jgi:hypothetical protein
MRNAERGGSYVKRFLTLAMAAFLVVSSTGFVLAQDSGQIVPEVDCANDTGRIIAWDVSIGAETDDHTALIADLQTAGFTVRTVTMKDPAGNPIPDFSYPACIDTLVITSLANGICLDQWPDYNPAEELLIANAVETEGLSLFLLNEYGPVCGELTADITTLLGATWNKDYPIVDPITFNAGSHYEPDYPPPLFTGVDSWREYHATHYTTDEGVVVRTGAGDPAMIAKRFGLGCTVITGDSNWIADGWIDDPEVDNLTLANNVFSYLESCSSSRWVRGRGNITDWQGEAASFTLVAKYAKAGLTGKVSFEKAGLAFESSNIKQLLPIGNEAWIQGTDDTNTYDFMIWAGDGTAAGEDTFRIKIWNVDPPYDSWGDGTTVPPIDKGGIAIRGKE